MFRRAQKSSQGPTKSDRQPTDSTASSRTQYQSTYSTDEKEKLNPKIGMLQHYHAHIATFEYSYLYLNVITPFHY